MTPSNIERRREVYALGQRAIDYYIDTGLCVFCEADDCEDVPHEEHCNVGQLSGVELTRERRLSKSRVRAVVAALFEVERQ